MNPTENDWTKLEERIGYSFRNRGLLIQAMTHSSYANEKGNGKKDSNERLEFLGDAVLELISSEHLFTSFKKMAEGELTKKRASLVCEPTLAFCARQFGLQEFMLLGKGEEHTGGRSRDSIISDACEALLGAIYLDGGFEAARTFVVKHILYDMKHLELFIDSKTILQEIVQEMGVTADYRLVGQDGPDHDKNFLVEVYMADRCMGTGRGHTKKSAEQAAAYEAVRKLRPAGGKSH